MEKEKFLKDVQDLLDIFEKNERPSWTATRDLAFAIIMKDHSEFSKQTAKLKNRAYGCKDQEEIKNIIARVSGYLYLKEKIISNEELDEAFFN